MNLDRLKPDLTKLNMAELKRTASRVKHVRVRMNRKDWIGLAAAVLIAAGKRSCRSQSVTPLA